MSWDEHRVNRDEQVRELSHFQQSLIRFNEQLRISIQELEQRYQTRSSRWQDRWQREDRAILGALSQGLHQYFERESPGYVERLQDEIQALQEDSHV